MFAGLVALNTKTRGDKTAEAAAAAADAVSVRDGVQQTAMQKDGGLSARHITLSVQSSRTASERLGRAHFAHYISYILFSILQQMALSFTVIYGLGYVPK